MSIRGGLMGENKNSSSSSSRGDQTTTMINVDSLASSLKNMMSQNLIMSEKCCIFKVPDILRRHNEKAYVPDLFSIGPWHHNNPKFKLAEKIKLKYLNGLLSRTSACCKEEQLKKFIASIEEIEGEAREFYAGQVDFSKEDFVKILVLDGCFLIELLRKDVEEALRDVDDPIFNMACMPEFLNHDLILLENQMPWIVLERLFNMTAQRESKHSLSHLALLYFGNIFSTSPPSSLIKSYKYNGKKHILDLLRESLISLSQKELLDPEGWQSIPSATKLVDAGIKFKTRSSEKGILDVNFNNGIIEIPSLLIQETTEVVIRNLISYEQCCPNCKTVITSYAHLLDNLINTEKDMEVLTEKGIMENWLNPEEATMFFNKLYEDAYVKKYYYVDLCQKVTKHYGRRWPTWRAMLMRNYFGTPWAIASQVAAAVLLILTLLQTILAMLDRLHPEK